MKYFTYKINYDKKYDVLYLWFGDQSNSYGDEEVDNIIWMKDFDDDSIRGLTIIDFYKMYKNKDDRIQELENNIDIKDILFKLKNVLV